MLSLTSLSLLFLLAIYFFKTYWSLKKNIAAAKASGIPYIISPIFPPSRVWLVFQPLTLKYLKKLPLYLTSPWLEVCVSDSQWYEGYRIFDKLQSEIYLVVAPGGILASTCSAEINSQIFQRRTDFPKPTWAYELLNIYGPNVVSTEGSTWRTHRKITAPSFAEKNNRLVWAESITRGQEMLNRWLGPQGNGDITIKTVEKDTMIVSLQIISIAGFGVRLGWPDKEMVSKEKNSSHEDSKSEDISSGHMLSYKDALSTVLANIIPIMLFPQWMMQYSPFKLLQAAGLAATEWELYMKEIFEQKKADILSEVRPEQGMDLMGALIKGSGLGDPESDGAPLLSEVEILGNAFVFILAGHETSGNTLFHSMLFLAKNYTIQRNFQDELERIFGDKPAHLWDYDTDLHNLFGGMTGAVMNEVLRLLPPVVGIPKSTPLGYPQELSYNGRKVVIPGGAYVDLNAIASHRNPTNWPGTNPEKFCPDRWLLDPLIDSKPLPKDFDGQVDAMTDLEDSAKGNDVASSLFRPVKGAYFPFSDGPRSCLGRRFAQLEILGILALIFRSYSVELAVDEWASDEDVAKLPEGGAERKRIWDKANKRVDYLFAHKAASILTFQIRGEVVPMRLVHKGRERFTFDE
ncbi:MAG: hypothetical protein M1829_004957 [Trizodia sp. TS-e1964]|nr:MAG: hypothetical protein M1829_004957 [Trizodia sp. TS-e1964]